MIGHQAALSTVQSVDGSVAAVTGSTPLSFVKMDVDGWSVTRIEKAGIEISIFKVAPSSVYASHAVAFECVCLVAEGSGELFLTDEGGKEVSSLACSKGDAYVQGANARHGFRNGPNETTLIYLRVA